jgi:hypothetical protein
MTNAKDAAAQPADGTPVTSGHTEPPVIVAATDAAPAPGDVPVVAPSAPVIPARVEPPSPDVALADEASALPGAHRGGFARLPTAPVPLTIESAPAEPGTEADAEPDVRWLPPEPAPHRGIAPWALAFAIGGLLVSLFVGWGFPIGLVGLVSGIIAVRRPLESRAMSIWAIFLSTMSLVYSAGWLWWAASQANLFG